MDLFSAARGSEVQIFTKIRTVDLLYVAGSEIQIFHERSKIVDMSLGHTVQRCKFFTEDPELWTLLCTAGSEVQVSLLNFKVVNFDCIKPRALHGS